MLLAIISTEHDAALLERHWPYFKMCGYEILGVGTEDGKTKWPEAVARLDTGQMGTKNTPAGSSIFGLVQQELDIWKYFLDHDEYDSVCVVEADNLFCKKPPENHPSTGNYLVTLLPNMSEYGLFRTPLYFSTPRWSDRNITALLYLFGTNLFKKGETEHFMSDRFPALVCYQHGIPFIGTPNWSPSVHASGQNEWIQEARSAIKHGAYCLHACKYQWQMDALSDLLPCL